VLRILDRCSGRLVKHVKTLERMLRFVHGRLPDQFWSPKFASESAGIESSQDVELLGKYCEETHGPYMGVCQDRLKQFKELASELAPAAVNVNFQKMIALTKLAYDVRRSSSFKRFIEFNLASPDKPGIAVPTLPDIVERMGQVSKFYRAAVTLTTFAAKVLKHGRTIEVRAIPAGKIQVGELAGRTAAQVRRRGGYRFSSCGGNQLQSMLDRWPKYRQHVELQLIVFYEENPNLKLYSSYIGCNKRSCYLCYSFIKDHGRFEVDGCHQSLYSLWTVPETVFFADHACAQAFQNALKRLCIDLEGKVSALRDPKWPRPGFCTHNESVANLSRVSMALTEQIRVEASAEDNMGDSTSAASAQHGRSLLARSTSEAISLTNLVTVPEEPLEESLDIDTNNERPNSEKTDSAAASVDDLPQSVPSATMTELISSSSAEQVRLSLPATKKQTALSDSNPCLVRASIDLPTLSAPGVNFAKDLIKENTNPETRASQQRQHRRRHRHHHDDRGRHIHRPQLPREFYRHVNRLHKRVELSTWHEVMPQTRKRRKRHAKKSGAHKPSSTQTMAVNEPSAFKRLSYSVDRGQRRPQPIQSEIDGNDQGCFCGLLEACRLTIKKLLREMTNTRG